jgi:hypothetical protein
MASPRDREGLTGPRNISALTGGRDLGGLTGKRPKLEPEPDPLADVEYTGSLETDAATELTALEAGYRDRATAERARFKAATDSEYWVAVCFTSREEKDRFLERAGLDHLGDKYLPGTGVAAALGVDLT